LKAAGGGGAPSADDSKFLILAISFNSYDSMGLFYLFSYFGFLCSGWKHADWVLLISSSSLFLHYPISFGEYDGDFSLCHFPILCIALDYQSVSFQVRAIHFACVLFGYCVGEVGVIL
jgi:hypothetical protein